MCLVGEYTEQDDEPIKKVCQFKRSTLRQCSGLPDASFGYAEGKPCVIIKMNRVSTTLLIQSARTPTGPKNSVFNGSSRNTVTLTVSSHEASLFHLSSCTIR